MVRKSSFVPKTQLGLGEDWDYYCILEEETLPIILGCLLSTPEEIVCAPKSFPDVRRIQIRYYPNGTTPLIFELIKPFIQKVEDI